MAFIKFESYLFSVANGNGAHDLTSDTLKIYLTNTAPNASLHSVAADLPGIAVGNGYSGPIVAPISTRGFVSGEYKLAATGPLIWTGSGTGFGPLRAAVLFNDTSSGDLLIGYWDYPTQINLIAADEQLVINFTTTSGVLKIG